MSQAFTCTSLPAYLAPSSLFILNDRLHSCETRAVDKPREIKKKGFTEKYAEYKCYLFWDIVRFPFVAEF